MCFYRPLHGAFLFTTMSKVHKQKVRQGIETLFATVKEYQRTGIVLCLLGILSAIGGASLPFILGHFFDAIIEPTTWMVLSWTFFSWTAFLTLWLLFQCVTHILDWRLGIHGNAFAISLEAEYVVKGFGRLLKLPLTVHKKHKSGELGNKISRAGARLGAMIYQITVRVLPQVLTIFVALTISLFVNTLFTGILLIGVLLYILILSKTVAPLAKRQRRVHKAWSVAYGDAHDLLQNVKEVKQAANEEKEQKKLDYLFTKKAFSTWFKVHIGWENLSFFQRLMVLITQGVIFFLSALLIIRGSMTIGELVTFNGYAMMIFGPLLTMGRIWQNIQSGVIELQETERLLQTPAERYRPHNVVSLESIHGDITFEDVSFYYEKKKPVLTNINFTVRAGEVVALVGQSGVGKSTLLDIVSGYHFPKKGRVLVDGVNIKSIDLELLRSHVATVPQEVVLFNDTIKTNLAYGQNNVTQKQVEDAARKAHALEFIEGFPKGWKQLVGERGVKLSVGQKQRIAIARAILRNPSILILDEPTSALDAITEKIITKSLEELMHGRTTFIIAHRLSTVRQADKIVVLKDGTVIEIGTHDELVQKRDGEYRRLYELQIGLHE